jgi:hypothetical protein
MALLTFKMASPAGKDCKDPTGKVRRRRKDDALVDLFLICLSLQHMMTLCKCRTVTFTSRWSCTASSQPWPC